MLRRAIVHSFSPGCVLPVEVHAVSVAQSVRFPIEIQRLGGYAPLATHDPRQRQIGHRRKDADHTNRRSEQPETAVVVHRPDQVERYAVEDQHQVRVVVVRRHLDDFVDRAVGVIVERQRRDPTFLKALEVVRSFLVADIKCSRRGLAVSFPRFDRGVRPIDVILTSHYEQADSAGEDDCFDLGRDGSGPSWG